MRYPYRDSSDFFVPCFLSLLFTPRGCVTVTFEYYARETRPVLDTSSLPSLLTNTCAPFFVTVCPYSPFRPSSPREENPEKDKKEKPVSGANAPLRQNSFVVRPFRGAAKAAAVRDPFIADAEGQTEYLPHLEPLLRLGGGTARLNAHTSPSEGQKKQGVPSYASATKRNVFDDEKQSIADLEQRIELRRHALVSTGVLRGPGGEPAAASMHQRKETTKNGASLVPLPPAVPVASLPAKPRPKPRRKNSLSGEHDFIAFDEVLPRPPDSPSEEGRPKGPAPRWQRVTSPHNSERESHGFHPHQQSERSFSPGTANHPRRRRSSFRHGGKDGRDENATLLSSGGMLIPHARSDGGGRSGYSSASSPTEKHFGGLSSHRRKSVYSRRVPSPGANGTLHFECDGKKKENDSSSSLRARPVARRPGLTQDLTQERNGDARHPHAVNGSDDSSRDFSSLSSPSALSKNSSFGSFTRTESSAFAVVSKENGGLLSVRFVQLVVGGESLDDKVNERVAAVAKENGNERSDDEKTNPTAGSRARKSVLTMSLRGSA
jgi:hypothetical protein